MHLLISVLVPTGDKTTDKYLISKGEKGVELMFEDLRTIAQYFVNKGGTVYPINELENLEGVYSTVEAGLTNLFEVIDRLRYGSKEENDPDS